MNIAFYLHDETDPVVFEKQLLWFQKHYKLISSKEVRDFYYEGKTLKNSCHLTIDDGWLSTYNVIYPLLKKYNIPASIFVSPKMCSENDNFWYMEYKGYDEIKIKNILIKRRLFTQEIYKFPIDLIFKEMFIDDVYSVLEEYRMLYRISKKERGFIDLDELIELDKSGLIEVGAHTMTHPILAKEKNQRSSEEIKNSIDDLSSILNRKITAFAYPNGLPNVDFGQREIDTVKDCGIELAYSVEPGTIKRTTNPLAIPRTCSIQRLKLGVLGLKLPSMHDQVTPRRLIQACKL